MGVVALASVKKPQDPTFFWLRVRVCDLGLRSRVWFKVWVQGSGLRLDSHDRLRLYAFRSLGIDDVKENASPAIWAGPTRRLLRHDGSFQLLADFRVLRSLKLPPPQKKNIYACVYITFIFS